MLTMKALPTLDGTSTVFGRVVKGFDVLRAVSRAITFPNPQCTRGYNLPIIW